VDDGVRFVAGCHGIDDMLRYRQVVSVFQSIESHNNNTK
jgi:hypothetical protein